MYEDTFVSLCTTSTVDVSLERFKRALLRDTVLSDCSNNGGQTLKQKTGGNGASFSSNKSSGVEVASMYYFAKCRHCSDVQLQAIC